MAVPIALGHPLGATGARITATLVYELRRRGGRFGLGSACIGGGQGIALLIENLGQAPQASISRELKSSDFELNCSGWIALSSIRCSEKYAR